MTRETEVVLVPEQAKVTIDLNAAGDVVLRRDPDAFEREQYHLEDGDVYIVIPRLYIPAAIERLKTLLAEGG